MLSECRNHIPFVLSEVRVSHVFYFLAGANFMIIASHCFYVQRCHHHLLFFFNLDSSTKCDTSE
ncbi:hypothetical protein FCV61_23480, partial [Vibrio sp. F12]